MGVVSLGDSGYMRMMTDHLEVLASSN